jgi:lipoprotein-releasing system permease protein
MAQVSSHKAPGKTPPFAGFEWQLAGRYLRARRREGFVSVIAGFSLVGIALGVATLIIVMAVMNGFRIELLGRILGLNGHATILPIERAMEDYAQLTDRVLKVPGVTRAMPLIEGIAFATANGQPGFGAQIRAFRQSDFTALPYIANGLRSGDLADFHGPDVAVIGRRMAANLSLGIGDRITLITAKGTQTPFGTAPRVVAFEVVGIVEVGVSDYDSSTVYLPLEAAQAYFKAGPVAYGIEISVTDPDDMDGVLAAIAREIGPDYRIFDWRQRNLQIFSALQVERNVMFLILTLIILVAALNIVSGLIMLVKDKGRDIAILRTMGASRGAVMRIFLIAGASIGISGTVLGLIIGTAFCANIETIRQFLSQLTGTELFSPEIYFLSRMPAHMEPMEVVSVVVMALALSLLATLYPSWRAARLDPIEALRYE